MGTILVYIQFFILKEIHRKTESIYLFSCLLFIFVLLFIFIIWYQISNLRALVATFIMAKIIHPSQYFSPYHVSSHQHMVCFIGTHQERQIFGDQSKTMNDTNRSSFGR